MIEPRRQDIEHLRQLIARHLGLRIDETKLASVIAQRLEVRRLSPSAYLANLDSTTPDDLELQALAATLTVSETYFFRQADQLRAFVEHVVPERMKAQRDERRLRILCAGCSSGEEAYSIAIALRTVLDPSWEASILAVDANPVVIERAKRARYSAWSLRDTPLDVRSRWFRTDGREFVLDDGIRSAVRLEIRNLFSPDAVLWPLCAYDIVFFRNVLMYFTEEQQKVVIDRIARALRPGGFLFLGHAETLRSLSHEFHLQQEGGAFFYRRRHETDAHVELRGPRHAAASVAGPSRSKELLAVQTQPDLAYRATTASRPANTTAPANRRHSPNLAPALTLLRAERFAEALESLRALSPDHEQDPEALLLRAVLHANRGQFEQAENDCACLLDFDECNAGAHYLLGLCCEERGQRERAAHHYGVAVYLDPGFALPRLYLGLSARKRGEWVKAQQELERALLLLDREDPARLLLFGGGFTRDTLTTLCRRELDACARRTTGRLM